LIVIKTGKVALGSDCIDFQQTLMCKIKLYFSFPRHSIQFCSSVFRDVHLGNKDWAYTFSRIAGKLLAPPLDSTSSYSSHGMYYSKDDDDRVAQIIERV
jgi:hypothetical protein